MNAGGKIFEILSDPDLGKKVKKISDKYNKEVSLVSQNGENFGTVRQGIIDRLNKFKSFDNFRFKNNAEKEAVENFIKKSTVQVPIGDKEYSFSYNGYKAIQNGDWQNYSPAENEKEGFDAFKSYPMFDLITTGTDGKEKNLGKISYNANEALKKGETYYSSFGDEMYALNSYYSGIEKDKPYNELISEAMQRIIDKAKANPSAQGIMNPDIEDPNYYLQFISDIDKEKIWQEFDNKLVGAIKTEADKVNYRTLVQNRMETLERIRHRAHLDGDTDTVSYIDEQYKYFTNLRDKADNKRDVEAILEKNNKFENIGAEVTAAYGKNVESESSEYVPQTDLAKSDNIKINISSLSSAEKYDFINLLHSHSLTKKFDLKEGWLSTKADLKNVLWLYLTPEEVNVYNKNYAEDPKKAEKYLEEMEGVLKNRRRVTNESIAADESAEEYQQGKESPFVGGIASIGRNLGGSIVALGDNIIDLINTGEINTYDDTGMFLRETQALKAGGSQHMKENYGTVAQFAYDTGLSLLEQAFVIATTKGVGNAAGLGTKAVSGLSGATMAMSAASNHMLSVADRGGNTAQILVGGLAAGVAEFIFEKFSIEKLLSPGSGKFVKDILKQSGVEASEELFTEVANIITDTVIMGEKSESNLRARELILNDGLTAEEAMKKVFLENLDRVLQSGVAGGISGGVMSGVMRGAEYGTQRAIEKNIAKSIANNATLPNVVKIIGEIEGRNPDYYTSDEAIATANAVLKMTNGTATKADYELIKRSEGARTVVLSAESTKAWDSLKAEADKRMRSAEYGMRSDSPSETEGASPFPTAKGEGFDVKSEATTEVKGMSFGDILTDKSKVKSATISDGEIISNGERVTIDNTSKVAGNVVLDEESYNFRKVNKVGYKAIQTMAKDLGMKVKYVDGLTDSEGKQLDGVITSEGIFINTQSKNPTRWAATHEFSHRMKQTGGKMWQRYQDYVISHLKETDKYEERYNLKKGAYAENEIDEEIASDYIGEMFADVKELSNFIRRNRRDAFGIRNAYYKVLDKLGLLDEKKKAQAMWAKAYREAMKNSDVEYEDENKYSLHKDAAAEIEKAIIPEKTKSALSDFRYSVAGTRVEMEAPVEETKDLIAMHNITESQLIEALHRGKMIMPSIAVTNKAFTDFGDISVIFRKDTINPENNSENKLYGADAWTPTQTQLKLNPKFDETTTAETLKNLKKTIGKNWSQIFNVNLATFKQTITANKGSVYNAFAENTGMQTAYALEKRIINSVPTKNGKIDVETLKSNLDESLNKDKEWREYKKWLSNISDTVIESYDRASTNDILENMKSQPSSAKTFNLSENGELTVPAAEYSSITEMKKNKNRLSENADADAKAVGSEFISFANDISNRTDVSVKNVVKTINTAFNNRYDSADIIKAFADNGINLSGAQAKVLQGLYKKAVELSTLYFEAKPHRNVGTEEYAMVVVPENTSFELTDLLDKNNVSYVTYDGSTKDRVAKINAVENVKFSKAGTRVEESESLKEENARLRAELENLHLQLEQAEGKGLDTKAIKKAAEDIKRAYFSKIKTSELHKDLTKLYSDMANNKLGGDEIGERIREIADKVIAGATETIEYSEYGDLLNTIRTTRIAVPEDDKASFADGFSQFKKSNRGKLNLNDDGYPLDALWDDLCADYPQLFSENTRGSEERLNRLLEVRDEFSPYEKAVFGSTESVQKARYALENDIMESFFKIPEGGDGKYVFYDTRASQAQKELQQAKEKYEKLLEKTVKKLEGKIEKTELAYENEINRIEQRHERELDKKNKELEKSEEKTEKLRDRYDREKVKKGIDRYFNYLFRMYSDPTDARHIPEALRRDVGNILERINFETKYTDKLKEKGEESALSIRLEGIADVFRRIQNEAWGVISAEDSPTIDAALREELEELISEIPVDESGNSKRLEDMTTEELKAVYEMLIAVHHAVTKSNEAFSDSIKGNINENAEKVDREMENVRSKKKGSGEKIEGEGGKIRSAYNALDKFVTADLYKPWDFFHKIGGTMEKLYMATRNAFDNYLKNLQTFTKKLDEATKKINVKKLDKVETIKLLGGAEIKLTRGQMIGIVATYKRPAGRTHILEGGVVTNKPWKDENGHKRTGVAPIKLNEHDVGVITEMLTSKETDMMFALVDFMSKECSKWGNETSVKLLGYEKYGEGWYYPIKVWDGSLDKSAAKKGEKNPTNKSFTKKLAPNAGNAIEINDFLDVVIEHVNSMNMYSTVALPLLDMERILNHKGEGTASKDVREAIRRTYGKSAEEFIYKWIRSVNGAVQKVERDFLDKLIANTKKAQIAFKPSVFLKQGTSIVRVLQVMNPIYMRSGIKSFTHPKETIQEMQENVPIAFWKSLGFRDPAMGTGIKNALLGTESVTDKLGFGLYGLADDFTWGIIYNAVKTEVKSKNKGIDVNSEEFKQKVVERFNYIIDRTQVVDSPFHSAQIMKSNNPLTKLTTSYMSEPLTTLNLYRTDLQDTTSEAIEKRTPIPVVTKSIRSTSTFLLSSLLLAIAGALPKMLKEDPEDKYDNEGKKISGWERFQSYVKEGFADESNPFNLVPYLNRVIDIWEGWEQKDWSFEAIEDVVNSIKNIITEEGQKKSWYAKIKDFSSAAAVLFGMPYGNAVKEIEGIVKTIMHEAAGEYGDYLITKSKWNVKDPKNKSKFMKYYNNALINGHAQDAAEIFSDYFGVDNNEGMKAWMEETARLYKATGDDKHFYNSPDKELSFNGKKIELDEKKYKAYEKSVTEKFLGLVDDLIKTEHYKGLSDAEKAKELQDLRNWIMFKEKMKYYPVDLDDNKHTDEVLAAMDKLYLETGTAPLGKLYENTFTPEGGGEVELDDKEYNKYVDGAYDVLWNMAYELVSSEQYDELNAEEKLSAFGDLKEYAKETQYFDFAEHEMKGWKKSVYTEEETFIENKLRRIEEGYFEDNSKAWRENNFNIDESKYSEAEVEAMYGFEKDAAAFYTSHEMNIPYEEGKYRKVQVYHDYLKDVMSLEEFAGIKAYANKVASTMGEGSTDSMSTKELKAYLDTLDYDTKTKGALFEAIGNKGWKNPYAGGKVGDGTRFPVITTSPVAGAQSEVQAPESEQKTENAKPPEALPGGYTGGRTTNNSSNTDNKVVTISYDASAFTQRGIAEIKKVERDANSYYNSPTQSDYTNNPLRHMHVYKTQLSKYMNLNDYAKIRAFVMESAKNSTVTADSLEKYLSSTDYTKSIKASLFEAIGDVNWVNPFRE